jgi:hypothetical protein
VIPLTHVCVCVFTCACACACVCVCVCVVLAQCALFLPDRVSFKWREVLGKELVGYGHLKLEHSGFIGRKLRSQELGLLFSYLSYIFAFLCLPVTLLPLNKLYILINHKCRRMGMVPTFVSIGSYSSEFSTNYPHSLSLLLYFFERYSYGSIASV